MKTWIFQRKKGKGNPWSIGWYTASGTRKEKQIGKRALANRFRLEKENELSESAAGLVDRDWAVFRREFEEQILPGLAIETGTTYRIAMNHLESICQPKKVSDITAKTLDIYIAARRAARVVHAVALLRQRL